MIKVKPPLGGRGMAIGGLVCSILALLVGGAIIFGAVALFGDPEFQDELENLQQDLEEGAAAAGGQQTSVFELAVGDCFTAPPADAGLDTVVVVDCEQPHANEVFALLQHPEPDDGAYPGLEAVEALGDEECQGGAFSDYVGSDYDSSRYLATSIYPTAESWEQGDRELACVLLLPSGNLEGSAAGAGD